MTFTTEEIKRINVDENEEWSFPAYGYTEVSVPLSVDESFKEKACKFLEMPYELVCKNGWIDTYAYVDFEERKVIRIYFDIYPHDENLPEKELEISITNNVEANELYAQLATTNGFEEFIDECIQTKKDNEDDD